ncbi:pyruvate, phosphate dikinase/phosphoenolpyruvate synthase regulator [Alkalibaculum sp. M08DMB]|uniref:Putative pyruvate, phosphate dikinase regulatory protein n=1 Tax=Alkalibaculum sporogenes TaxID=2655001 RepID=A0A6A7KBW6_9FIRM|nr:pyruvate, water dikinase regulatory protein [Alkalibaculum sporogenes]MPW27030.1 pyruvate, phosphate dikinase/phosphoenolpyruvate synthase regulator [Alkalibaculum sporogenes]
MVKGKRGVIYVVSDSLGETGELVAKAGKIQFNSSISEIKRFPFVLEKEQISEIVEEASQYNAIIVYTLVVPEMKEHMLNVASKYNIKAVDVLGSVIDALKELTQREPLYEAGLNRRLDADYFKKVEAIEFAVKYDDGKDARGVKKADVVLLGVSRTSKTPLSMYLAHKNIRVANIPIVPEVEPPKEIFEIPNNRIIALTNDPDKLNSIRQERLKALGLDYTANYASMERILGELDYAEKIYNKLRCPVINVSDKAIEETASIILSIIRKGD